MASYRCTLKFANAGKTSVVAPYDPAPNGGGFTNGDVITFTSAEGKWHVIFPESPFRRAGASQIITGDKGEELRCVFDMRGPDRKFPFRCLIEVGADSVGWADAGNEANVKST